MKLFLALLLVSSNALSQGAWPTKPVRILVGFAPGGNTDIVGRLGPTRCRGIWFALARL